MRGTFREANENRRQKKPTKTGNSDKPGNLTPSADEASNNLLFIVEPPLLTIWLNNVQYCGGSPGSLLAYIWSIEMVLWMAT